MKKLGKHAMAEMAALKKGKAPAAVMAKEKAEYGLAKGGCACGGPMKKAAGGVVQRQTTTSKGKAC